LLQANPDVTSHFLNSSTAQTHYCKTVKLWNWLAAGSHRYRICFVEVFVDFKYFTCFDSFR